MKCITYKFHRTFKRILAIEYYESGHMVYVSEPVLRRFHDDVAKFVNESTAAGR